MKAQETFKAFSLDLNLREILIIFKWIKWLLSFNKFFKD
jgi:hypothetical protein